MRQPLRRPRRVWAALLGALVIGSISNGMDLLALDAIARKRRRAR